MPIISVIIPTHNREDLVQEAINSVLAQTFQDFEIIVVDDGSSDNTRTALKHYISKGLIHYQFQSNSGDSEARNTGIRLAKGKYIAFLDSDDLFLPQKLEKQLRHIENNPNHGMIHSGFSKFDDQGKDLGYRDTARLSGWVYPAILLEWESLIGISAVMIPREVLDKVGMFDPDIWSSDLDMWSRIARKYPIAVIPECLTKIRLHPGNMSGNKINLAQNFKKYILKAFSNDRKLGAVFQRRVLARMYAQTGLNLSGEGTNQEMQVVRNNAYIALQSWPLEWRLYLAFGSSFISTRLRSKIATAWRRYKYRPYV